MKKNLPNGWVETELSSILKLKNGYAFKSTDYKEEGIPVIRISDIQDGLITSEKAVCVTEFERADDFIVEKGDILIAMSGATTGKFGVFNIDYKAYQNQRVGNLRPVDSNVNKKFIYYLIGNLRKEIEEKAYGGAQPNISAKLIEEIKINLPPFEKQETIVAKLDQIFSNLETAEKGLEKIPVLLKQFRQAVLMQAVTGKLTEEWRSGKKLRNSLELLEKELSNRKEYWLSSQIKQNDLHKQELLLKKYKTPFKAEKYDFPIPKEWVLCTWDQLSNWITYGFTKPMPTVENGIPKITVKNVKNGGIDFINTDKTTVEAFLTLNDKDKPKFGDILITKDGATLGRSAVVNSNLDFCIGQSVAVIWLRSTLSNKMFLHYVIESKMIQDKIWEVARGMGMPHLSITDFRSLSFGLPSLQEQAEIVCRVEALFSKADAIEAQYKVLQEKIDNLPQAVLAKAFRGELN